jgi:hypothetical protein
MNRLFIYKEYGAKYEIMVRDITAATRAIRDWETYQKGFEVLALSVGSANNRMGSCKKSLTVNDLLVKVRQVNLTMYDARPN